MDRRQLEREKLQQEVHYLDEELKERRQQDSEGNLTVKLHELELKRQNLRYLEEYLQHRTKEKSKVEEQSIAEERYLDNLENDLKKSLVALAEHSAELDNSQTELEDRIKQIQCLVIVGDYNSKGFIKTDHFQVGHIYYLYSAR